MAKERIRRRERTMGFPVWGFLLLIFASLWLLRDLNVISWEVPWLPIVLIVIAIGMIFKRLFK